MTVHFAVREQFPQVVVVDAEGDAIPKLRGNIQPDHDDEIPNVIELWARAIQLGMLAGQRCAPDACGATLLERSPVKDRQRQRYRIALAGCDRSAFRVLGNLLDGLALTATVFTEPTPANQTAPLFDPRNLDYAPAPTGLPFRFDHDREYGTQLAIEFAQPPSDTVVDEVVASLEVWSTLVAACGFAPRGKQIRLGGMPDGALLFDSNTITEGFSEAFFSDPAAFHPTAYYALALHGAGKKVARVKVS